MAVSACGQQGGNSTANAPVNAAAAPAQAPRRAYCFFKERETKDWKARLDKAGNVVVTGKVYREDSRYKAVLGPSTMNGTTAEIAPTLTVNDTGYAAPGDWWNVIATIPDSQAIDTVAVNCGEKTIATLKIPRKK
ncbi:MAG TPA: hypothetical protein VFW39_08735 [Sphingomicrobium sp.]|nr:hypothetical protein [Sphingomicrobium sp.]